MAAEVIQLKQKWVLGRELGEGGFGKVFEARNSDGGAAAVKLVPKEEGTSRDLLTVDLDGAVNIIPVVDSGEHENSWVLVMPLAEKSLRDLLIETDDPSGTDLAISVLTDVADALKSIDGKVVHRDIKPENILLYEGKWCLSDFGISRYAEASTATDTQKFALSAPYAGPERWRSERATNQTDVYSLGVVAYELLEGRRPFVGPTREDFREQHLETPPERPSNGTSSLSDLILEMLYKPSDARPTPANLQARIDAMDAEAPQIRIEALQSANSAEVERRSEAAAQASTAQLARERRAELQATARIALDKVSLTLKDAIAVSAPAAEFAQGSSTTWHVRLNRATLEFPPIDYSLITDWGGWEAPAIDVVASAEITLRADEASYGKIGRSHSLWFCDAQEQGVYKWYETGFMFSPLIRQSSTIEPFSLNPGEESAKALWPGMSEFQVAWPFTALEGDSLTDFVQRWGTWFGSTSQGGYQAPSQMPERPSQGTWRR